MTRPLRLLATAALIAVCHMARADEPAARFFRGVNLNGPAVVIDGNPWAGGDAPDLVTRDLAFENQAVELVPPTDPERARMIRSSRWNGTADVSLKNVPAGTYQVFLYVWEDNNSETFSISLNGREVQRDYVSGPAGTWRKLGPWAVTPEKETIRLTTRGGAANLSGIEVWQGVGSIPDPARPKPRDPATVKRFDDQVAPVLARRCLECHGGSERAGGLNLSREEDALKGGESGAALVAGKPDESLLWQYVESDEMPKGREPLGGDEKQLLKRWIADGAKWGTPAIDPFTVGSDRRAGYDWWSLQPVGRPEPPAVARAAWVRNDVDRFILAGLEARGLDPAPEADRRTLVRRLYFDLTGLPPEPEEVERFVADPDPQAYEKLVDALLDSPHYGERWARHWLDVIRFGESQGYERNKIRENAWRYRDWVVQAFNRDLPYDEFVRRQIAGDVLHPDDLDALIATGYHVCGTWDQVAHNEGSESMRKAARQDELEDLVGALGQSFLGLTINCARCHDHKFDPISQVEYYQTAALLSGVRQKEKERDGITLKPTAGQPGFSGVAHVIVPEQPPATHLLERGNPARPREVVAPAGLKALRGLPPELGLSPDSPEAQRRVALAKWLSDPRNPLTARVFVNRLWHYHFGRGIVDTPSDFGFSGGRPSHPELLDWLATRFMEGGWKVKPMHRLIVTSAAYRQSSTVRNEKAEGVDADNRLLWRANLRRLEGEAVRDAALAVSGALNRQVGGPSYRDMKLGGGVMGTNAEFIEPTGEFSDSVNRRTLYRLWARQGSNAMLDALDCPDPSVMSPRRPGTITPIQALALLNDVVAEKCAERFAERVRREAGDDPARQIDRAYRLAYARAAADREREAAQPFVAQHSLAQFCLILLNANEFLYVN